MRCWLEGAVFDCRWAELFWDWLDQGRGIKSSIICLEEITLA